MGKTVPNHGPRVAVPPALADSFVAGAPAPQAPSALSAPGGAGAPAAPTAATGAPGRKLVPRKSGEPVRRLVAYFPPELARRLAHWCADHDADTSSAIVEAVRRMLEAPGA